MSALPVSERRILGGAVPENDFVSIDEQSSDCLNTISKILRVVLGVLGIVITAFSIAFAMMDYATLPPMMLVTLAGRMLAIAGELQRPQRVFRHLLNEILEQQMRPAARLLLVISHEGSSSTAPAA